MLIGILQTGEAPDALRAQNGDYPDMFMRLLAARGFAFQTWHVSEMQFPPDIHAADGWLITGSRYGVYEEHPFIAPLETFIRAALAAHVPMVGVCFGHQIIAQAMGGTVSKYEGGWAVGAQDYDLEGETITLNAWHQDQVIKRPASATCLASNSFCENAILAYGNDALTVQAHPEFNDQFIAGMIQEKRNGSVPEALLDRAQSLLDAPKSSASLATRIADFFQKSRG